MIRRDTSGSFIKRGLIFTRYFYSSSKYCTNKGLTKDELEALLQAQEDKPIVVLNVPSESRTYWMFQDEFYWENEDYTEHEVLALVLDRKANKEKRVRRAVVRMEQQVEMAGVSLSREPITDDVKMFVWNRDGGKCVRCGSQEKLEFDHIIPLAKGGGNTARNLQILCETCNRTKGAELT